MARELRNIGASVRARLRSRARVEQIDFQILLTRSRSSACSTDSASPTSANGLS